MIKPFLIAAECWFKLPKFWLENVFILLVAAYSHYKVEYDNCFGYRYPHSRSWRGMINAILMIGDLPITNLVSAYITATIPDFITNGDSACVTVGKEKWMNSSGVHSAKRRMMTLLFCSVNAILPSDYYYSYLTQHHQLMFGIKDENMTCLCMMPLIYCCGGCGQGHQQHM